MLNAPMTPKGGSGNMRASMSPRHTSGTPKVIVETGLMILKAPPMLTKEQGQPNINNDTNRRIAYSHPTGLKPSFVLHEFIVASVKNSW